MVTGAVDNSFSSDVSIPQFKIFNSATESSPASSTQPILSSTIPRPQVKSHLKQVTTAEDEELISKNFTKKVHFMEDSENKMANQ